MKSVKVNDVGRYTFIYSDIRDYNNLAIAAHTFSTKGDAFEYALSCVKVVTKNKGQFYKVNEDNTIIESYSVDGDTKLCGPNSQWKIVELGSLYKEKEE